MYLNCHTYYSMRYGTLSPEQLVAESAKRKITALTLTDINNTSACFDFVRVCRQQNIHPMIGIEFRKGNKLLYIGIAKNNEGFKELNMHLTHHNLTKTELPPDAPSFDNVMVIYPYDAKRYASLADNEYIGIRPAEVNKLLTSKLRNGQDKLVILCTVTFKDKTGYMVHTLLRAIDNNIILDRLTEDDCAKPDEQFYSPDQLLKHYQSYPAIIKNTEKLIADCNIDLDLDSIKNRKTFTGSDYDDRLLLEKLAFEGLVYRYGANDKRAKERIVKELNTINSLGFATYFLITWDIIRYAGSRGYHHVGRGSGANSVVAYCLRITDVEPIQLNLYFERFLNPKRTSPPDFDIDFSWDERDDVTDYIFKRYGNEHTALLATYSTFKGRSITRELGKVYGLPKDDIDLMVHEPFATEKHHGLAEKIFRLGKHIVRFPNHLSIHAGGVLISERPITYYTAMDLPPKGFPITHWDMIVAEDIGFHKYDILSQRGLGHIKDAVEIIATNQGKKIDIHRVSEIKEDPKVKAQLRSGNCIGCFYIESPAMRGLLKKLRCDNYLSLVAASSIIRPGVAKSGMMREYIQRFHNPDDFEYPHPVFEEHLAETYGVMVYQEDVIKIMHHFAGLDLPEADYVRKMMSGKARGSKEMGRIKEKFYKNCKELGYREELTIEVWRQIESFGGYSFAKGHSASYAVESFQSLYLKAYHPKEFMVAVINNFGGFYRTELYVHEARMCGANIKAPCVNRGNHLTSISGDDIYLGFIHLRDLERRVIHAIVRERKLNGSYQNLEDLVNRVPISREQLIILIRAGALRFTGKAKQELLWEKNSYFGKVARQEGEQRLLHVATEQYEIPKLEDPPMSDSFDQIELLGFPLCAPFDMLKTKFRGDVMANDLEKHIGKRVRMVGYYVTKKHVHTVNRKLMNFGTWIDVAGNFFDTTHFPIALLRNPFRGKGCYLIRGKVTEDFGFPSLEVDKMAKLEIIADPRYE